ncbi:uncharacterized protein DUF3152 [Asanoa ferruginea]|uniref:Uncharacterized protein DUF3152 n=1 Tax=Asanoa ferruginea TaxID=53367 RepID=A0A3D9ZG13_9ACTN|nr:DUF3152 domain-containing protein [Asanoa ferruginea]REF95444.1 uncharacterized protein DUF3152 [Asanoa ferruginea]GIF46713.1 hypothetical protein Afe04nite_12520 [Asanoa ferruginea]
MATPIPGTQLRDNEPDDRPGGNKPSADQPGADQPGADQPGPKKPGGTKRPPSWRLPALAVALIATGAIVAVDLVSQPAADQHLATPATSAPAARQPAPEPPTPAPRQTAPHKGQGTFSTDRAGGLPLGRGKQTQHFHVAVEKGIGLDLAPFAASVDAILGDPRSWIADGRLRLQRVGADEPADFTIYLASAGTSEAMCAEGGLDTDAFTSCQLGGEVIINADRWLGAVPYFEAPLAAYQAYAINHEVGHQLGHQHEACPSPGAAAPVMQQQTLGMQGCLPNGWPYVNGRRQTGPPIP